MESRIKLRKHRESERKKRSQREEIDCASRLVIVRHKSIQAYLVFNTHSIHLAGEEMAI